MDDAQLIIKSGHELPPSTEPRASEFRLCDDEAANPHVEAAQGIDKLFEGLCQRMTPM